MKVVTLDKIVKINKELLDFFNSVIESYNELAGDLTGEGYYRGKINKIEPSFTDSEGQLYIDNNDLECIGYVIKSNKI